MRITLISIGHPLYALQLANSLANASNDVTLYLLSDDLRQLKSSFSGFLKEINFRLHEVKSYPRTSLKRFIQICRISLHIAMLKPSVLHLISSHPLYDTYLISRFLKFLKTPIIMTLHDARLHPGDIISSKQLDLFCKTLSLCSHFIVHGKSIAKTAANELKLKQESMSIVPHGNFDIYLSLNMASMVGNEDIPNVLFFGRMKEYKGLSVFLQAIPHVLKYIPDCHFTIAGKGEDLDRLLTQCKSIPNVQVLNYYIDHFETAKLFSNSSILVLPYIEASQSGPLNIALTFGCPVVATNVGSMPEIIGHEKEGLIIPPKDAISLAEAIISILVDKVALSTYRTNARKKAENELSWPLIAKLTVDAYNKAIKCRNVCCDLKLNKKHLKKIYKERI